MRLWLHPALGITAHHAPCHQQRLEALGARFQGGIGSLCFYVLAACLRSLFRYVFDVVEQRSTMALFTARADGRSASPAPLDFCKACLWQVMDASIDLRDPNTN